MNWIFAALTFIILIKENFAIVYEGNLFHVENWNFVSRFCFIKDTSSLQFELIYPEVLGSLSLDAFWDAPEIWDVAYTSRMTCREKITLLQGFSPNQKFLLSAEENGWCQHVDFRNFDHPFEVPDFRESESGMVSRLVEVDTRYRNHSRHDHPRQLYAFSLESYQSSILQSAYARYQIMPDASPNWVYCKSPEISFTPGKISWWFFALDSCKESFQDNKGGRLGEDPIVYYRLEMQNGKGGGNLFTRHFSVDEFGSLETVLIFWVASIGTLFIGGWILITEKNTKILRIHFALFGGVLLFAFLKWLSALMCLGHLSNTGHKPAWLEIISDLMGGSSHSALVALLLLLASGHAIVHKAPGKRLKMALVATVAVYTLVQLICGITATLAFDTGRAKYIYQSPTGYTLVALNVTAWLVFLLVAMYTNTHWPSKRMFYLQLIAFYTVWFWTLPIILIINGDYIPLWRRLALHRSIASTTDLLAHLYLLYTFWPSKLPKHFAQSGIGDGEDGDVASLAQVSRTSVTPITIPSLVPEPTASRTPRKKPPKSTGGSGSKMELGKPGETSQPPLTPRTPGESPRPPPPPPPKASSPEPQPTESEKPTKDVKSTFLKKLML
uniref:GpcrRhopsn4 domain-containing protein n=1 Tax=Mesocestoides corti TaxID=53468 RepID=A0A5K3FHX1_MESCO